MLVEFTAIQTSSGAIKPEHGGAASGHESDGGCGSPAERVHDLGSAWRCGSTIDGAYDITTPIISYISRLKLYMTLLKFSWSLPMLPACIPAFLKSDSGLETQP